MAFAVSKRPQLIPHRLTFQGACQWKPIARAFYDGGQQNIHAIVLYLYEELEDEWCLDGQDPLAEIDELINKKAES